MAGTLLAPADRAYSLAMMRRQLNSAVHRRMNTLLLLDDGWTAERVALFQNLAARYPAAETVTVALDNATDNRAASVRDWLASPGCRVRLVYLPPYAPNLNRSERLWWSFKKKTLWNVCYPTLAKLRAAIRAFLDDLPRWRDELAALLTDNFHRIGAE